MSNFDYTMTVGSFQKTKDEQYLYQVLEAFKSRIQAKAYTASKRFGLDLDECESTLVSALWKACLSWDIEKNNSFEAFAHTVFNTYLKRLFEHEHRKSTDIELVYCIDSGDSGFGSFDIPDPRVDIEALLLEEESAKDLYDELHKIDAVSTDVATLVAQGYTHIKVAEAFGYNPTGIKDAENAKKVWVARHLKKLRNPCRHYYLVKMKFARLPIRIRDLVKKQVEA